MPRVIADYIAGMTDRFALEEYKKLFDRTSASEPRLSVPSLQAEEPVARVERPETDGACPAPSRDRARWAPTPARRCAIR